MEKITGFIVFLLLLISALSAQDDRQKIQDLDQYIKTAQMQWKVPGLAVSVVKDGNPVLTKGFGLRGLDTGEHIDGKTLFAICSTTKAMTAACMAMLIDQGLARWDDAVIKYLPEFQLFDPYVTRELRIRDLFTHNAGLGNADALWYIWHYAPDEILSRMRMLPPSYPFRAGYTYQNIMYAAAGKLIEKISGRPWEIFVQQHIFDPLGMENTFANQALSNAYQNRSQPHYVIEGTLTPIPDGNADLIAPAGAVWSTIEDMQKWMLFVLDSARVDGKRLISEQNYQEWLKPQAMVSDEGFYPTQKLTKPHWKTYALGWFQHDYYGRAVSFHTGSLQGTIAMIGLIPAEKLGVYIFGNLDHAEVRHAIMYKVFDIFGEDDPKRDWSAEMLELYKKDPPTQVIDSIKEENSIALTYPLDFYGGIYESDFLGNVEILSNGESLEARISDEVTGILTHKNHNTFMMKFMARPWLSENSVRFEDLGDDGLCLFLLGHQFYKVNN